MAWWQIENRNCSTVITTQDYTQQTIMHQLEMSLRHSRSQNKRYYSEHQTTSRLSDPHSSSKRDFSGLCLHVSIHQHTSGNHCEKPFCLNIIWDTDTRLNALLFLKTIMKRRSNKNNTSVLYTSVLSTTLSFLVAGNYSHSPTVKLSPPMGQFWCMN